MYCRNCGSQINDNAIACPKCGANPRTEKNFCPACGIATNANQVLCINCGASLAPATATQENGKTVAIVAHLTFIGWIVALIINNQNKSEFGSFYLRQMLGLIILDVIGAFTVWLFFIGLLIIIFAVVMWIISFINAINNKATPVPVVGATFQKWFSGI